MENFLILKLHTFVLQSCVKYTTKYLKTYVPSPWTPVPDVNPLQLNFNLTLWSDWGLKPSLTTLKMDSLISVYINIYHDQIWLTFIFKFFINSLNIYVIVLTLFVNIWIELNVSVIFTICRTTKMIYKNNEYTSIYLSVRNVKTSLSIQT